MEAADNLLTPELTGCKALVRAGKKHAAIRRYRLSLYSLIFSYKVLRLIPKIFAERERLPPQWRSVASMTRFSTSLSDVPTLIERVFAATSGTTTGVFSA